MSATFSPKEVPTGTVNGINTVFTLAHTISQIDDVFVDGAIYIGTITPVGAVITLADAPVHTIYVDYWYGGVPPTPVTTAGFILVQDAYNALKNRKKDISDVSTTVFCQWCDFINKRAYRVMKSTDPERYMKETTLAFASGTALVTTLLPIDFRDIAEYGSGLFYYDQNGTVMQNIIARTMPNSSSNGFWIKGRYVYLTPVPNSSGTILLRYLPTSPVQIYNIGQFFTMDGTSGTEAVIPDEYLEAVTDLLCVMYDQWDESPEMEGFESQKVVNSMGEFLNTIRKEPLSVFMPDATLNYDPPIYNW